MLISGGFIILEGVYEKNYLVGYVDVKLYEIWIGFLIGVGWKKLWGFILYLDIYILNLIKLNF